MDAQLNSFNDQAKIIGEIYTKAATAVAKTSSTTSVLIRRRDEPTHARDIGWGADPSHRMQTTKTEGREKRIAQCVAAHRPHQAGPQLGGFRASK
jgi:hypothetical protein